MMIMTMVMVMTTMMMMTMMIMTMVMMTMMMVDSFFHLLIDQVRVVAVGEGGLHLDHLTSHLSNRWSENKIKTARYVELAFTCFRMVWMYEYFPCLPLFLNRLCIVLLAVCR